MEIAAARRPSCCRPDALPGRLLPGLAQRGIRHAQARRLDISRLAPAPQKALCAKGRAKSAGQACRRTGRETGHSSGAQRAQERRGINGCGGTEGRSSGSRRAENGGGCVYGGGLLA